MIKKRIFISFFLSLSFVFIFSCQVFAQPIPDSENMAAYFQAAVDWGIEVSARYLAYLAAAVLAVSLFKS